MRVYISVDMEGISGIHSIKYLGENEYEYERGRKFLMGDVNAAISGAIAAGATEILVNDAHGSMRNIRLEELDEPADLISGLPKEHLMMAGLDDTYDAAVLIGYHTKSGDAGICSHTISMSAIRKLSINGKEYGELAISSALAGFYNIPVVAVSGDDQLKKEVQELLPNTAYAQTKEAISRTSGKMYNLKKSQSAIKESVKKGIESSKDIKPFNLGENLEVEITLMTVTQADSAGYLHGVTRIDPLTVAFRAKDISEVDALLFIIVNMGISVGLLNGRV